MKGALAAVGRQPGPPPLARSRTGAGRRRHAVSPAPVRWRSRRHALPVTAPARATGRSSRDGHPMAAKAPAVIGAEREDGRNPRAIPSMALPCAASAQRHEGRLSRTGGQAMRIQWRAREYERTCDDCGYVWRVPKAVARPRLQDPEGRGRGGGPSGQGFMEGVIEANAALSERAAASRRCPKCESDHYKQRTIRS
jgi:hypothetical protein